MKISTMILIAASAAAVLITRYWVIISRLRAQHRELEASGPGINDIIYRSPDPSGDSERQKTLSQLKERISAWEERRWWTLHYLTLAGKYSLGIGLGLAAILAIGSAMRNMHIYRDKMYPVRVVIVDRIWRCEAGAVYAQANQIGMRDRPAQSHGQAIPATCPILRQDGKIEGTRVRYYWLVEATDNYPIIHRGERFIREVELENYRRGAGNRRNWMFRVSGGNIHREQRPFYHGHSPQGTPWPVR